MDEGQCLTTVMVRNRKVDSEIRSMVFVHPDSAVR